MHQFLILRTRSVFFTALCISRLLPSAENVSRYCRGTEVECWQAAGTITIRYNGSLFQQTPSKHSLRDEMSYNAFLYIDHKKISGKGCIPIQEIQHSFLFHAPDQHHKSLSIISD